MSLTRIDEIIESVSKNLDVPRDNIDFLENYSISRKSKILKINFYAIRFLCKVIKEAERFYKEKTGPRKKGCFVF